MRDLPYTTQFIPLEAICAVIRKSSFNLPQTQNILERWFLCGIMGEMYGGADAFICDDFDTYFIDRAKAIMQVIEGAMEKTLYDKGSEQTINSYGVSLED